MEGYRWFHVVMMVLTSLNQLWDLLMLRNMAAPVTTSATINVLGTGNNQLIIIGDDESVQEALS